MPFWRFPLSNNKLISLCLVTCATLNMKKLIDGLDLKSFEHTNEQVNTSLVIIIYLVRSII